MLHHTQSITDVIREELAQRRISLRALARRTGIAVPRVHAIAHGMTARSDQALRILAVLGRADLIDMGGA